MEQDRNKKLEKSGGGGLNVLFLGQKECAARALEWTVLENHKVAGVVTRPGSVVEHTARQNGIPVITVEEAERLAVEGALDLCVSVLYWNKIRKPLICAPRLGCINFHPALLPDYKGLGGCSMAILDRLTQWGVSAHYVDEGFDTGKIIRVFRFSFDWRNETGYSLKQKTEALLFDLYRSVLRDQAQSGVPFAEAVPNQGGKYVSRSMMLELMKLDLECDDIERKVHAFWFPPHDGAYIEVGGRKYTLTDSFILKNL